MKIKYIQKNLLILLLGIPFFAITQSKNYKIVYRHCHQFDTTKILSDTFGVEAILIGNSKFSNYSLNKANSILEAKATAEYRAKADSLSKLNTQTTKAIVTKLGFPNDSIGTIVFHDKINDSVFVRAKMPKEYVITTEFTPQISWSIVEEYRLIQNHACQKAVASFRGRKYTAWFTKEIAIADGPWKFFGLPGLIMDIYDAKGQVKIYVSKIEFPTKEEVPNFKNIGTPIKLNDYFFFMDNFIKKRDEAQLALMKSQPNLPEGVVPTIISLSKLFPIELRMED